MPVTTSDAELWQQVIAGDTAAFEQIVERYQGVVSAIAYSRLGNLAASQDVAQETFWVAWSNRDQLRDYPRLPAWLCGIARNLSHQESREALRSMGQGQIDAATEQSIEASPLEQSIAAEQADMVWQAVHELPEHYRDVMLLYYRQEHSVSQVALALDLSEDAVKQRLSRARSMLRDELIGVIEETLVRSRPGKSFTAKVMGGLVAMGVAGHATKASAAVTSVMAGPMVGQAAAGWSVTTLTALGGGLLGALGGLGGAWLGIYLPAKLAPTETERQWIHRRGTFLVKFVLIFVALCMLSMAICVAWLHQMLLFAVVMVVLNLFFIGTVIAHGIQTQRGVVAIRARVNPQEDPNHSYLYQRFGHSQRRWKGKRYTSRWHFLGMPLIDIQLADHNNDGVMPKPQRACGWIAIGDIATGGVACGGIAYGGIALGGLAVGGLAVGGGAVGLLSLGGGALGIIAFGGGAIGWQATGGAALALHTAFGGCAIAWHLAGGGFALAHDMAAGGGGWAQEFNTKEAKALVESFWMKPIMETVAKPYVLPVIMLIGALPMWVARKFYTLTEGR